MLIERICGFPEFTGSHRERHWPSSLVDKFGFAGTNIFYCSKTFLLAAALKSLTKAQLSISRA